MIYGILKKDPDRGTAEGGDVEEEITLLRVFLVEDESIIRETLRDTVPWVQCGYTFAGEAGDGEMAQIGRASCRERV